jgi:hypothetical protein
MGILIIQNDVYDALPTDFRRFLKKRRVKSRGDQGAYQVSNNEYAQLWIRAQSRGLQRWLPFTMRQRARREKRRAAMELLRYT